MPIIEWGDKLKIGVDLIDEQHEGLVMLANELYDSLEDGISSDVFTHYLGELVEYTKFHFNDEEALMSKVNYPDLVNHQKLHGKLISQTKELFESTKGVSLTSDSKGVLKTFLVDWLSNHILNDDLKIAKFVSTP